jgi:putative membrane protein
MIAPARTVSRAEAGMLLAVGAALLLVSAIGPKDRATWWMETAPIFIAVPLLLATAPRFRFTALVYYLVFAHALVLMLGGHYTYAETPPGFWVQQWLGLARNDYDRFGHLVQGLVPALVARESLLRLTPLRRGGWLFVLVSSVCLAISACYELVEWWAAALGGAAADAFLGTQGDPWDTQKDMLCALIGAVAGQALLARVQDRQLGAAA